LQWQPLEEVVGAALERAWHAAFAYVVVHLPRDLPLLKFDAVLIERVLVNLLENVSKYTPPGSTVTLSAQVIADHLSVSVADNGRDCRAEGRSGFRNSRAASANPATPGVGLGLAIAAPSSNRTRARSPRRNAPAGEPFSPSRCLGVSAADCRWLSHCPLRF